MSNDTSELAEVQAKLMFEREKLEVNKKAVERSRAAYNELCERREILRKHALREIIAAIPEWKLDTQAAVYVARQDYVLTVNVARDHFDSRISNVGHYCSLDYGCQLIISDCSALIKTRYDSNYQLSLDTLIAFVQKFGLRVNAESVRSHQKKASEKFDKLLIGKSDG